MSDTSNSLDAPDGLAPRGERAEATPAPAASKTAIFTSWNMFSAKNYDGDGGHFNRAGLHSSMQTLESDVVGLQEVDNGMVRTRWTNLARAAGESGGYEWRFARVRRRLDFGLYGNALLIKPQHRQLELENVRLPRYGWSERRNAVIARVKIRDVTWDLANTHLSNNKVESADQLAWLLDRMPSDNPCVVMGDLNREKVEVARVLESRPEWAALETAPTWSSADPHKQIDWFIVRDAKAVSTNVSAMAVSDHCAATVELRPA